MSTPAKLTELSLEVLGKEDAELVGQVFSNGPSILIERGWSPSRIQDFLRRPVVVQQMQLLGIELQHQESLDLRNRFMVQRRLRRSSDQAVATLERALIGDVPELDDNENQLVDEHGRLLYTVHAPTEQQYDAATQILDRLGCRPLLARDLAGMGSDADVTLLLTRAAEDAAVKLVEDTEKASYSERSLSRERVRVVMEKLAGAVKLGAAQAKAMMDKVPKTQKPAKSKKKKKHAET